MTKLDNGQRNLLRLTEKGAELDGWAPVSAVVLPLLEGIPTDLIEIKRLSDGRGVARLTNAGRTVLSYT